jgi:glyoxylase-like metal-dependent hydrolase (beta-lactamase superfamily II)
MDNWFTVERVDHETYAISEYKHWEETHCYLLLGQEQALLIDTGLGVGNIKGIIDRLTALPVTVATTHVHWDHIGGHKYFDRIYVHEAEMEWLEHFPIPLEAVKSSLAKQPNGLPEEFPEGFHMDDYSVFQGRASGILRDNDGIDLGNRRVRVLHTPGHSPGHICFYEPDKGFLYTGDLIYAGTLDAFYPSTDPCLFMQSVKKVKALPVQRILPAHHSLEPPVDLIDRVDQAFTTLYEEGKLKQGNGIFCFDGFRIHI